MGLPLVRLHPQPKTFIYGGLPRSGARGGESLVTEPAANGTNPERPFHDALAATSATDPSEALTVVSRSTARSAPQATRPRPVEDRIVVARGLVKTYDSGEVEVHALRGLDLDIRKGEMVAIMGPSGCGKTTLLNCLSGIDDFTSGEVWIAGKRLSKLSDNAKTDFRAQKMGFIFQNYNLLPVLRAVENVELPLLVRGEEPKESRERAEAALAAVGLGDIAPKKPAELSGGQQQRVAIARALVNEPDIVFADEPTGNLDTETSQEVVDLMKRLHRGKGLTFIIVTHDSAVGNQTERVIMMRNGQILKSFQPTT